MYLCVQALPTLKEDVVAPPPVRRGGCVGSIANQTIPRKKVAGRPNAHIQQEEPNYPARRSCGSCKRTITIFPSYLQQLPNPIPSLLLQCGKRRYNCHRRKKQLNLKTLHNGFAPSSAGTIGDQQIRLRASQPSQPISPPHPPMESIG